MRQLTPPLSALIAALCLLLCAPHANANTHWGWLSSPLIYQRATLEQALIAQQFSSPLFSLYQRPWLLGAQALTLRPWSSHAAPLPSSAAPSQTDEAHEPWPMPTQRTWPIHNGRPVITAPQVQRLTWTMDNRRSLWWVLSRYRIRRHELERLNPDIDLDNLQPGQTLVVWQRDPSKLSQSVGRANMGRVLNGEPLPRGKGYEVLYDHRAFGTYYTVSELYRVLNNFHHDHPEAHPLIIGDLSYSNGGRIQPHLSHRSGRDVDITYPRHSAPPNLERFHYIRRRDIDLDATLDLIRDMIRGGTVELILIDRPIQRLLAARAQELGAPADWIAAVFQFPMRSPTAIVRDARGHDDHMHVRFFCQPTDYRCW